MLNRRTLWVLAVAGLAGGVWMAQGLAQQADRPAPRQGDNQDRLRAIEQFRQRMQERLREQLGATEEEWKVLSPRIEKVQQLQRQIRGGFPGLMRVRLGRPGGDRPQVVVAPQREQSEVEKETDALRSLLEDKASGADAIQAALEALRKARSAAEQDLAAARKELRSVVTIRQEAQLVVLGVLD